MLREGQLIGGYTLIRKLGKGGFGEVWLAERRTALVTTQVALKFSLDENINLETVKNEALVWSKANGHPNVLPIIEADIYDGHVVIVSEFAPDGSLEELLSKHSLLPITSVIELTMGILSGLEFLHSKQIIHRDIKPANVLLQGKTPRLTDFGVSRLVPNNTSVSQTVAGTPKYMSPETFDGKRNAQTDVWAVGVMLYQILTGKFPFPQEETTELIGAIVLKEPESLPDFVPPLLKNIVGKALAKNPLERYQSAEQMRQDLFQVLTGGREYSQGQTQKDFTQSLDNSNTPTYQTKATLQQNADITPVQQVNQTLVSQPSQVTVAQAVPQKRSSNLSTILGGIAVAVLLLIGVLSGGIYYYVVKVINVTPTPTPSYTPVRTPSYTPTPTPTPQIETFVSNEIIQKAIAAVEEEVGGEFKFVGLDIYKDGIGIGIQDPKNPENYDSYSYSGGKLTKSPKKMSDSQKRRNRLYLKGDVDWTVISGLLKTAKEKTSGLEDVKGDPLISVSHWTDVNNFLAISIYIYAARKDFHLIADAKGNIKKIGFR